MVATRVTRSPGGPAAIATIAPHHHPVSNRRHPQRHDRGLRRHEWRLERRGRRLEPQPQRLRPNVLRRTRPPTCSDVLRGEQHPAAGTFHWLVIVFSKSPLPLFLLGTVCLFKGQAGLVIGLEERGGCEAYHLGTRRLEYSWRLCVAHAHVRGEKLGTCAAGSGALIFERYLKTPSKMEWAYEMRREM